jgi:hypothetical protein
MRVPHIWLPIQTLSIETLTRDANIKIGGKEAGNKVVNWIHLA